MSVRSRINELIDSKNLQDAIKTVEIRCADITEGDILSVYLLIQKLIGNKEQSSAIAVLDSLKNSSVFLSPSDFSSVIKGLMNIGSTEPVKGLILSFIDRNIIKESQAALAFIESSADKNEFEAAFEVLSLMCKLSIPLNERAWERIVFWFSKKQALVYVSQSLKIMGLPAVQSLRIWEEFIGACLKSRNFLLAFDCVLEVTLVYDKSLSYQCWNALLAKVLEDSEYSSLEICKVLDKVIELNVEVNGNALAQALRKLVMGKEEERAVNYAKIMRNRVNALVLSGLISKLVDENKPKEALEICNLVVLETFGPLVTMEKLEIPNEKLKWILKHQQVQMMKYMKITKTDEDPNKAQDRDELNEEKFIFL